MNKLQWKSVLKDVGKFYLLVIVLYGFAIFAIWAYGWMSLESLKIKSFEDFEDIDAMNLDKKLFSPEQVNMDSIKYLVFIFSGFAATFSLPPKKFFHVIAVAASVFLINLLFVYQNSLLDYVLTFFEIFSCLMLGWLASYIWIHFKDKNIKTS